MDINNEELKKDLEEQYAMLEEEINEDKKKKRYLIIFIFFLFMFLTIFGTTFSYFKLYSDNKTIQDDTILKDLYIEGYENAFDFQENVFQYVISVPSKTNYLNVKAVLKNPDYSVEIKGNDDLIPGVNEIKVSIKDKDENIIKEYVIFVTVEEDIEIDPIPGEKPTKPSNPSTPTNPNTPTTPSIPSTPTEVEQKDLFLKNIVVSNHKLNEKFEPTKTSYIVDDISINENNLLINVELADKTNKIDFKLNGSKVTRVSEINDANYAINFNVKTELVLGANKLEIIIKDDNGNEKIYYLFLVVNDVEEEQKVIELIVDYGNDNGNYMVSNIIPGWQSTEKQHFTITNKSNYNINVDIKWKDVYNNFANTNDLEYNFYEENKQLKNAKLPIKDDILMTNVKIPANSKINYYISFRYLYSEEDQNIDQGKSFSAKLNVSLTE